MAPSSDELERREFNGKTNLQSREHERCCGSSATTAVL
jgi:hypothetical protein